MSTYRYVVLDPTGNTTCLVLDPVPLHEEAEITRRLMAECEQVAYLESPSLPGSAGLIRLMGGEFCGNAAMASACYLASLRDIPDQTRLTLPMEMSGIEGILSCMVCRSSTGWEGTVTMPKILSVFPFSIGASFLTAVRMEGILHLIRTGSAPLPAPDAEALLLASAREVWDEAVGLLQWDEESQYMKPLVYVRHSNTLVWETACGSGSAVVGAWKALQAGEGATVTDISQPGGVIRVTSTVRNGAVQQVLISGKVRIGNIRTLELP